MLLDQAALEKATSDVPRALELTEEALAIAHTLHANDMEALISSAKAAYLTLTERFDEARSAMRSALRILRDELLDMREVTLQPCIALAIHDQDLDRAAKLLGYRKADSKGWVRETRRVPMDIDALVGSLSDQLGEARFEALMAEGAVWSKERAIEEALIVCSQVDGRAAGEAQRR